MIPARNLTRQSSTAFSPEDIRSVKPSIRKPPGTILGVARHDRFVAAVLKQRRTCAVLFTTLVFEETWHPTTTDKNGSRVRDTSGPIKKGRNRQCHTPSSVTKSSQSQTAGVAPSNKTLRQLEHEIRTSILAELKIRGLQAFATNGKVEVPCQASWKEGHRSTL
jgi:hypothetical protein